MQTRSQTLLNATQQSKVKSPKVSSPQVAAAISQRPVRSTRKFINYAELADETEDTFRKDMMGRCLLSLGPLELIDSKGVLAVEGANPATLATSEAATPNLGSNPDHVPEEPKGPTQQTKPP
jgi:hypothetical protein